MTSIPLRFLKASGLSLSGLLLSATLSYGLSAGVEASPVIPPAASSSASASASPMATAAAQAIDAYLTQPDLRFDGAVAVVVQGGRIVFSKGYGYEDGATAHVPVDPKVTRFQIASVTKTFIGTRIAQLIAEGRIQSLDDPANRYLKGWQLPNNAGQPVTLRHLLTHQAGFAEAELHDFRPGDPLPKPDAAYFAAKTPAFIGPSGVHSNYSNFGLGVLGRLIADVTSKSTREALADGIWKPAGMQATVSKIEAGAIPRQIQATAFYPDGSRVPLSSLGTADPIISLGAGNTFSTGEDMGRYLIGLLGGSSELGVPALVPPAQRALMFSRQGGNGQIGQAYGMAFMVSDWNGTRLAEHAGRALAGQSVLVLLPDSDIGFFISVSGEGGAPSAGDLFGQFIGRGRLVPPPAATRWRVPNLFTLRAPPLVAMLGWPKAPEVSALPPVPASLNLASYAGSYDSERALPGTRQKWVDWFIKGAAVNVAPDGKGGLRVGAAEGYRPIAQDVFWRAPPQDLKRLIGWNELLTFERGSDGQVQRLWFNYPDATYTKLAPSRTPGAVIAVIQPGALLVLTGLLALAWKRRSPGRGLALVMPVLLVLLPVGFFGFWPDALPAPYNILYLERWHLAPFVLVGDALLLVTLLLGWKLTRPLPAELPRWRAALQRTHGAALVVGGLALAWCLARLNGLGWPL